MVPNRDFNALKAQNAIEYLMTYGWAILMISIVLAALFELGVFNPYTFVSKAPTGACQVLRPEGAMSTHLINLVGTCNNEIPEYAATFNGKSSFAFAPNSSAVSTNRTISVFAWVYPAAATTAILQKKGSYGMNIGLVGHQAAGEFAGYIGNSNISCTYYHYLYPDSWYFVGFTFNGSAITDYVNGKVYCTVPYSGPIPVTNSSLAFGGPNDSDGYINGKLANVQIYNSTLSANEINGLYMEGIGGEPITLQSLIAWYPLNGDTNDYSGNGDPAQSQNITFVSNWYYGYTAP
ncbi:MAG: LamG domain-containing protein [Candidatus Micrarchaeia archaeon]